MILIADSGATKTDWCLIRNDAAIHTFHSSGANPYYKSDKSLISAWSEELSSLDFRTEVKKVIFYGAGCLYEVNQTKIRTTLLHFFPNAEINVFHDLLGAARALCKQEAGIACILGTGSNACYFDGKEIKHQSGGAGFIIGDEGSGADIGRRVMKLYFYDMLTAEVQQKLEDSCKLSKAEITDRIYRQAYPNRFLGSFAPFAADNIGDELIALEVDKSFRAFFRYHIIRFPLYREVPCHFTGSIAFYFKDQLLKILEEYNCHPGNFVKNPLQELVSYHM